MPIHEVNQSFNNGKATKRLTVECDSATMSAIVALMPKGQTIFVPTATGAQGTARPRPISYIDIKANCFDRDGAKVHSTFVVAKLAKNTLSGADIKTALVGKVETPNGTACDKVSIKSIRPYA